jgi:hypothetical protein
MTSHVSSALWTLVEIFYQELATIHTKALVMVPATVLEIFYQDFPSPSYKSPRFGKSYSTRNLLPGFFEPLTSTERLSTVSSPFLSFQRLFSRFKSSGLDFSIWFYSNVILRTYL